MCSSNWQIISLCTHDQFNPFLKLDIFFEGVGSGGGMHCGPPCVVFTRETFCHGSGSYFNYFCREMPLNSMVEVA